ncbi:MAG: ATP-binding protein [Anaerolineae bacterium]|nr:ATP-binding protein [Anaerolineae bacterium]
MGDARPDYAGKEQSALLRLLSEAGARPVLGAPPVDLGLDEHLPFPFMAVVGQYEMRLALLLAVINPAVGGVLLIGPRGVGKTVAVRSLSTLLPDVLVSDCPEGCLPEDPHRRGRRRRVPGLRGKAGAQRTHRPLRAGAPDRAAAQRAA